MPTRPSIQPIPAVPQPQSRRRRPLLLAGAVVFVAAGCLVAANVLGGTTETTATTYVGVESIVVDFGAGNVTLTGATGPDVDVRTTVHSSFTSTPVTGQRLTDGVLTISASCPPPSMNCGVDAELTVPTGVPVAVRLTAGEVNADNLDVPDFQAAVGSGRVEATFVRPPDLVDIDAGSGEIVVKLPDAGYRINAETRTGTVEIDLRQDPDAARVVRVQTGTGTVTLGRN
ncbi:MAG: DUF4097 family beta strand repeat-containing protein [Nakamurella sp.]